MKTLMLLFLLGLSLTEKIDTIEVPSDSITSTHFLKGNYKDAAALIKGMVPGLDIFSNPEDILGYSTISMRGISSLINNTTPLVLINGVEGSINTVAPESIASIEVIKNLSASAIYGLRGGNGAILITTKGRTLARPMKINYSGYLSWSDYTKTLDMMDASYIRDGYTLLKDEGWNTDWLGTISRPCGFTHNHSVSAQGGGQSTTYFASATYREENGKIRNSANESIILQGDVSQYFWKRKIKVSLTANSGVRNLLYGESEKAYINSLSYNPTSPIYNLNSAGEQDSSLGYYQNYAVTYNYINPLSLVNEMEGSSKVNNTDITGTLSLEPIKGWTTQISYTIHNSGVDKSETYLKDHPDMIFTTLPGYSYETVQSQKNRYFNASTGYDFSSGKSSFTSRLGFSRDTYRYDKSIIKYDDKHSILDNYKFSIDYGDIITGLYAMVGYDYDDRYSLEISLRRDENELHSIGPALYPAVSASWNLKKEFFLDLSYLDFFKLSAGYGKAGKLLDYQTIEAFEAFMGYIPDSKNEVNSELNIILDAGLFDGRLGASVNMYYRNTENLQNFNTAPGHGFYPTYIHNVGSIRNMGVEATIFGTPVKNKNFKWNSTFSIAHNCNTMYLQYDNFSSYSLGHRLWYIANSAILQKVEDGKPYGNFFILRSVGLTSQGKWAIEVPDYDSERNIIGTKIVQYGYERGEMDRTIVGNAFPKAVMNWSNTFTWFDFDLFIQLSGKFGFQVYNVNRVFFENKNVETNQLKSTLTEKPIVLGTSDSGVTTMIPNSALAYNPISEYLESGDYLKLSNISLGYTYRFKSLRLLESIHTYVSAQNLFCLTSYSGIDPELTLAGIDIPGIDNVGRLPSLRYVTLGLSVTF